MQAENRTHRAPPLITLGYRLIRHAPQKSKYLQAENRTRRALPLTTLGCRLIRHAPKSKNIAIF
jgi:hypothetical protein